MSKAKEGYNSYLEDIKNGEIISEKADNIFIRYIEELQKENEYFRLLFKAFNKHVSVLEQITGKELDVIFGELKEK